MPSTIELIAVDLDGTLLRSDGSVCPDGLDALRRAGEKGVKIVVSTVRRFVKDARSLYAILGFSDPLICSDGTEIYSTYNGELWLSSHIPKEVAANILDIADRDGLELSVGYPGINYWKKRHEADNAPPGIRFTNTGFVHPSRVRRGGD
jgi:hydroxymethylpyrimidine pyrophosphatase-like HAD family hydrolase